MTRATHSVLLAVAIALAAIYLFPLYWMYVTSLKQNSEIFAVPPGLVPQTAQWGNYVDMWRASDAARHLWNSTVIALGVTGLTVAVGTGAAYVLARYRNLWIDVTLFTVLLLQVLPPSLMITPIFVGFSAFGLLDTPRFAVVLAFTGKTLPFYIILCRAAFMTVPRELEEAALMDGNSRLGAFFNIAVPLARNGILVCAILIFMQGFGEFIYSRSIIQDNTLQPASVRMLNFIGPNVINWNSVMAFASIFVTPILALFVILQRRIVSGLTLGALK